jgi:glycosyltransferase involved in cell wall biosynthesis
MAAKVSIVIPCYNHGHFIREALESVSKITDKSLFEVIIMDDGSTDEKTIEVLNSLEKEGYKVIHQKNMGLGAARNNAIKVATGKYILPLDCDNKIKPEYITQAVSILDADDKTDVVYADAEYFGDKHGIWEAGEFNLQKLMIENYIDACAVYRKSIWEKVGGYDEKMPVMGYEDWDFWLRVAFNNGGFKYIHKSLFDYRYSNASMIRTVKPADYFRIMDYMEQKHMGFLGKKYLNNLINYKVSKEKGLAVNVFMRGVFPRLFNLFTKMGLAKKKDIL